MTDSEELDDIDLKILSELQKDGRIRNNELASRVGLSPPPCRRRVRSLRERGGAVVYLRHTVSDDPRFRLTDFQARMVPRTSDGDFHFRAGTFGHRLYSELDVQARDLKVDKHRYSGFMPNSSDLDSILRKRGVDTVIITGTVTNVCCESNARDASMLGYKVIPHICEYVILEFHLLHRANIGHQRILVQAHAFGRRLWSLI